MLGIGIWLIPLSVALAALAFIVLVVFLVIALVRLSRSLKRTEYLIEESNEIARNVNHKIHAFDPLFDQFSELSHRIERKAEDFDEWDDDEEDNGHQEKLQMAAVGLELLELGLVGWSLVKKMRRGR